MSQYCLCVICITLTRYRFKLPDEIVLPDKLKLLNGIISNRSCLWTHSRPEGPANAGPFSGLLLAIDRPTFARGVYMHEWMFARCHPNSTIALYSHILYSMHRSCVHYVTDKSAHMNDTVLFFLQLLQAYHHYRPLVIIQYWPTERAAAIMR